MRSGFLVALILCLPLGHGCASTGRLERYQFAQVVMGVRADIAAYAESRDKAIEAARAAFGAMNALDGILSDYRRDSEAMRLAGAPAGTPVAVSDELYDVLRRAVKYSELTDGAFDVTAGPLVQLWRESRKEGRLPGPAERRAALARVGWKNLVLGPASADRRTVTLMAEGMRLDFGGIGKGYAADRALAVLREHGLARALVAVAGDIAAGDPPPGAAGWTVGLSRGGPGGEAVGERVVVSNRGVSTSGSTEQFVEIDGVRYSHIMDPRSGLGVTDRRVVTVIADDATGADALATAFCVLDLNRAAEAAQAAGVGAEFQWQDEQGAWVRARSDSILRLKERREAVRKAGD